MMTICVLPSWYSLCFWSLLWLDQKKAASKESKNDLYKRPFLSLPYFTPRFYLSCGCQIRMIVLMSLAIYLFWIRLNSIKATCTKLASTLGTLLLVRLQPVLLSRAERPIWVLISAHPPAERRDIFSLVLNTPQSAVCFSLHPFTHEMHFSNYTQYFLLHRLR